MAPTTAMPQRSRSDPTPSLPRCPGGAHRHTSISSAGGAVDRGDDGGDLGRATHDLVPGARADIVLLDAENVQDALVRCPPRALVIAGGEVVHAGWPVEDRGAPGRWPQV
ncbi:hypothetical protein [Jiangella anatolica]|uniref:hypothetical protein n=1 Tax=Jiangella anatolica TaxID=2670374 RepID=UPI0018F4A0E0|nr:hypothetical protein [Jiangella anatolica]